ncbi:hypothetical protein [Arcobacter porcinus]|uniref:Uncharacterized protein n=1 Tax=Arcobacter porcinus TaxID=1935204 RepID=A0ABX2YBB7_9BACT|nr:hypothetical protein [Arcobacter porcinus]OCL86158.1 hypothetical protein AAX30_01496 [Arcobacter porcinus]OCL90303.1 hypothetical protein AAX28_01784 [Arcobacter porcinus]
MKKLLLVLVFIAFSSANELPMPKFESLAEEAAYVKKQKEEQERKKQLNMLTEEQYYLAIDEYFSLVIRFFDKYALKKSDSLKTIDEKYKNREKLYEELQEDGKIIKDMREKLILDSKYYSYTTTSIYKKKEKEFSSKYISKEYIDYLSEFGSFSFENNIIYSLPRYELYIKACYSSYESRQSELIKQKEKIEKQKREEEKEKKDRAKVKKSCDKWLANAKKEVNKLGIGDNVVKMKDGKATVVFTIKSVEKNKFLLYNSFYGQFYDDKSNYIPRYAIDSAPSVYCYN